MKQKKSSIIYNADGVDFTIYKSSKQTKSGPKDYWLLADYATGKRRLLSHTSEKAARQRADEIRSAMAKGQASRMALSNGEWQSVVMATEIVKSVCTGDSVHSAVKEWAAGTAMLGDRATLLDAVKFYLAHNGNGPSFTPTRFADAAPAYHAAKVAAGLSASHCQNIHSRLDRLAKVLPADATLDGLRAGQLETAVSKLGVAAKTKNEYRAILSNFFGWAAKQSPTLVPNGFNPAKEMEQFRVGHQEVEFLRVGDLRKVLAGVQAKRPDLLMLVVLVCFAGLRPSEACRISWDEIGENFIRLRGAKTKTGYARQVPIQPNLKHWLALSREENGLVCPGVRLDCVSRAILRCSSVRLPHDAMRHGYATHRQMIVKNVAVVADEMGNSVVICRRHDLNACCSEAEAKEWFNLMPPTVSNIINMPSAAEVQSVTADAKSI
jgi:integrase